MQQNPAEALREIEQLRNRTHQQLDAFWFPLMLFGALAVVSSFVGAVYGGFAAGMFWLVAGPLGGIATGFYYDKRESRLGVESNPVPWIATSVGVMVGCFVTGFAGGSLELPVLSTLGPLLTISVGYLVFGRLAHNMRVSVVAVLIGLAVVVMWLAGLGERTASYGAALFGIVTFGIGVASRRRDAGAP